MGTCVSRDQIHNNCSTGLASVRHHPQGVAGLPAHNIDEDPQHHIVPGNFLCQILYFKIMTFKYFIPGIVTSNPYVEVNDILLLKHKYIFCFCESGGFGGQLLNWQLYNIHKILSVLLILRVQI